MTKTPREPQVADAIRTLSRADGATIAYRQITGKTPGVMFLGGFGSDMSGAKASALAAHCRAAGRAFLRFDYLGHGASSGRFEDGTIGRWIEDAIDAFDRLTEGPQIVVGSSMGGWIMLHLALARPLRVAGLLGVAAAPDFTEELVWNRLTIVERTALVGTGVHREPSQYDPNPSPITLDLIQEGRHHLVLDRTIPIHCPVRLLHGMRDTDVPWMTSARLAERLLASEVKVSLIKDGDHRLSRESDLRRLCAALEDVLGLIHG